ncbi:hypothetical protein C9439_05920 [archaeon SCG-AAA382B04]|nr:hypothetical protein C9439_05920 [archaeon SCG-AAA382B04]
MSTKDLKKYEKKKTEIKNKVLEYIKEKNGDWVSEVEIEEELDCDFDFVGVDEALTGEFWSVRSKIQSKAAKVKKDGYYEWTEFYRIKPKRKSTRFWSALILLIVLVIVILFHLHLIFLV